ncbi:MAG: hypothetical protein JWP71_324 [Mucilaginibacter sp.]|nr:hypothetical protein [Mucilaginibacter sp.]
MITKLNKYKKKIKTYFMKTRQKPATSKLVARFDNELREIIMNDLKMIRGVRSFLRVIKTEQLSVA